MTPAIANDNIAPTSATPTAAAPEAPLPALLPAVDIDDRGAELVLTANVPGAGEADVTVRLEGDILTVEARAAGAPPATGRPVHGEFGPRLYRRRFELGVPIRADDVAAAVKDGVLTITLPKAPAATPRKVTVRAG